METAQLNNESRELEALFSKLDVSSVPNLQGFTWEEWHEGSLGACEFFLTDEIASRLKLQPGMLILNLDSGRGCCS